jgi:hypothetical protein
MPYFDPLTLTLSRRERESYLSPFPDREISLLVTALGKKEKILVVCPKARGDLITMFYL